MINFKQLFAPLLIFFLAASSLQAQKTAGIYHFSISIDKEMLTIYSSKDESRKFFSGSSTEIDIPEEYVDSLKLITQDALRRKKKLEADMLYPTTKRGNTFESMETASEERVSVAGLPFSPFKKAVEQFPRDQYLQVLVEIEDGKGAHVDLGNGRKKIKPMISMKIKAYNAAKDLLWKEDLELKNLGKLRRIETTQGSVKEKSGQVLTTEMILGMYELMAEEWVSGKAARD